MIDRGESKELLNEILSRPEFETGHSLSLLEIVLSVLEFIAAYWLPILIICLLVLAIIIIKIVLAISRHGSLPDEAMAERTGGGGVITSREALASSRSRAVAGNYREALRYLLLSSLLQLEEKGVIKYRHDQTNGEYIRKLRAASYPGEDLLKKLTGLYERVWYGKSACGKEDYDHARAIYRQLLEVK